MADEFGDLRREIVELREEIDTLRAQAKGVTGVLSLMIGAATRGTEINLKIDGDNDALLDWGDIIRSQYEVGLASSPTP